VVPGTDIFCPNSAIPVLLGGSSSLVNTANDHLCLGPRAPWAIAASFLYRVPVTGRKPVALPPFLGAGKKLAALPRCPVSP
jgi:hypothetical protein